MSSDAASDTIDLSPSKLIIGCLVTAVGILLIGQVVQLPVTLLGLEIFATIIGLFPLRLDRVPHRQERAHLRHAARHRRDVLGRLVAGLANARAGRRRRLGAALARARASTCSRSTASTAIVHADTMLFILGLTFFVSVIAQTRLLETHQLRAAHANQGDVLPTIVGDHRGGRVRVGHSRRRLDDRAHHPDARRDHVLGHAPIASR